MRTRRLSIFGHARSRASQALDRLSPNARGIVAMLGATLSVAVGDALMKLSTAYMPPGEVICIRGAIGAVLIWSMAVRTGVIAHLRQVWRPQVMVRTIGDMSASFFFICALPFMPLAEAAAILQTNPLGVTAAAALLLGEKVGWRRWSATGIGFFGALLIIQPGGATFTWASVLVLLCVVGSVTRDVSTRKLVGIPTVLITAAATTCTLLASFVFAAFEQWQVPTSADLVRLGAAAVCMLSGQMLMVTSIRAGDVSAVVPFRYSAMIWTLLLSAVIWNYVPNAVTLLGIVIVAGAGLYVFFREQTLARRARLATIAAAGEGTP